MAVFGEYIPIKPAAVGTQEELLTIIFFAEGFIEYVSEFIFGYKWLYMIVSNWIDYV